MYVHVHVHVHVCQEDSCSCMCMRFFGGQGQSCPLDNTLPQDKPCTSLSIEITISSPQAVWAGWGHASENPRLPEVLSKHNIAFLGPPQHAMWALGDKIASCIVAQTASVPTLPWSGSGTPPLPLPSSPLTSPPLPSPPLPSPPLPSPPLPSPPLLTLHPYCRFEVGLQERESGDCP